MLTGKTLFAFALAGVAALAGAIHFLAPDAMRALGQMLHGGQQ
jgi:hypothetical protein